MTRIRIASITACLSALILTATTHAAPSEPRDPAARRAEMMKKFDTNKNGTLDPEEKEKLKEEMKNRRGGKNRKEWTPEHRAEMLKEFDKDGDGELNEDERKAARESMRASRGDRDGSRKKDN